VTQAEIWFLGEPDDDQIVELGQSCICEPLDENDSDITSLFVFSDGSRCITTVADPQCGFCGFILREECAT
jgi:hypothetical protein